ncbi:hypothetical protein EV361DRAFT_949812 [Lentinula raphanica]|nr:hypothetical protein EV361DRAFT_949812 [Lentinula raphanica]
MFYDLRFIHLMIIGLILMSADSSPTPLPGSKISKIVQSAKSAPPSDEAWAYMLGQLVETNPDWGTSTNEVVKAKFLKAVARAIDQPDGYLAVDISFMHDRGPLGPPAAHPNDHCSTHSGFAPQYYTKFSRSVTSLRLDQLSTFFNNKKHAILHHITISGQKNPPCESWLLIALLTFTHFLSVDSNVIAAPLISKPWNDEVVIHPTTKTGHCQYI